MSPRWAGTDWHAWPSSTGRRSRHGRPRSTEPDLTPPTDPIFVVGLPRSGTTLLAAMLGAHSRIDCGPETRFFPHLEAAGSQRVLDVATWPDAGADFVMGLRLQETSVAQLFGQDRDAVRAYLAQRTPSAAALLESLTAARAAADGKPRWAEKTPRHIMDLAWIRREWPAAQVIRVVRDPRDVALSLARVPFGSESVGVNLAVIARQDRQSRDWFRADGKALTVRFEDLVAGPTAVLDAVCRFLGETLELQMVAHPSAQGIAAPHEWWKQKAAEAPDPTRIGVWQRDMSAEDRRLAAIVCREPIREHGYEGAQDPRYLVAVVPIGDSVRVKDEALVLGLGASDGAVSDTVPRTIREVARAPRLLLWGSRDQLELDLGRGALRRTASVARLGGFLVVQRLRGHAVPWVQRETPLPHSTRPSDRAAGALVRLLARRVDRGDLPTLFDPDGS